MPRSRLVPLALAVTLLLAVVAIVAGGRPLGASSPGGGGLPLSFWDYTYTTVVIVLAVLLLCLGVVALFIRGKGKPGRSSMHRLLYYMVALTAMVILGTLLSQHHVLQRLHVHVPREASGQGPEKPGPTGRLVTRSRAPGFKWPELFVIIGLFVCLGAIAAAIRARGKPATRVESAPEALADALDESLDDLRADPDLRRAIVAAYARMERALTAAGIPRHPAEAPLEYLERALLALDTSALAVRRLTDLFEWARFSHHEPEPSMRDDAVDALVAVRDELRASEPAPA